MSNYELFNKNVVLFKKYEIEAANRIKAKYNIDVKRWCDNSNFDFQTTDNKTFEVKAEPASLKTHNCFIEYFAYGVASGISISKADDYIITDTINYHLIKSVKLKELLCQKYNNIKKTRDNLTSGYLLKKQVIIENSIII